MAPDVLEYEISRISISAPSLRVGREERRDLSREGDRIALFDRSPGATSRLEPEARESTKASATTIVIGGLQIPVIDTPVVSGSDWSLITEYVVSNSWASFPSMLRGLVSPSATVAGAFLEWESGVPVLQLVVDRSNPASRKAAYEAERVVGRALPNVLIRFRLLDLSDVAEAKSSGLRVLFLR